MKKIISLYQRNFDGDRQVYDDLVPGAGWVIAGEGRATVKYDGTCCLVKSGMLFKRYHCRQGKRLPDGFELEEKKKQKDRFGKNVVKLYGWLPVRDVPEDKWYQQAWQNIETLKDGTYELIGPKVQGNPYKMEQHKLVRHGAETIDLVPVAFDELKAWFASQIMEGIVWYHPNGNMVKIKRKDFGYPWPVI